MNNEIINVAYSLQNVFIITNTGYLITVFGVLWEYPTTKGFQLGYLKNGTYTYTVSGGNGRVF